MLAEKRARKRIRAVIAMLQSDIDNPFLRITQVTGHKGEPPASNVLIQRHARHIAEKACKSV